MRFLERRRATPSFPLELSLAENLLEVLRRANGFVPSAAGSILLDDPAEKQEDRRKNLLTFIAVFGEKSESLVGQTIPADQGIAGRVYLTGETYVTSNAPTDRFFYRQMDEQTSYQTESLIAVPIRIEQEVCGVLELINRTDAPAYSREDRNLLEIFAGYISISIQNVLDGRQAQEIAKRDNLTGLYNDRYL
ncbi:MAG: GAF domain-containing protein, partial [Acidobacteriota bacterium]